MHCRYTFLQKLGDDDAGAEAWAWIIDRTTDGIEVRPRIDKLDSPHFTINDSVAGRWKRTSKSRGVEYLYQAGWMNCRQHAGTSAGVLSRTAKQ